MYWSKVILLSKLRSIRERSDSISASFCFCSSVAVPVAAVAGEGGCLASAAVVYMRGGVIVCAEGGGKGKKGLVRLK